MIVLLNLTSQLNGAINFVISCLLYNLEFVIETLPIVSPSELEDGSSRALSSKVGYDLEKIATGCFVVWGIQEWERLDLRTVFFWYES
jgi:hypothetical protein